MFNQIQISPFRNIFAIDVGRYKKKAPDQRLAFAAAQAIWLEAALGLISI
jgi:putative transposase